MKRIFVVHGWQGHPDEVWFPWLKNELENRGFQVSLLQMPDTEYPVIEKWVPYLANAVGDADEQTYFVGHSIGCQAILRYLEALPSNIKVGGAVFVAGFLHLTGVEKPDEVLMCWPWINNSIDFEKVRTHTNNFIAIFSDNDIFVPLTNEKLFEQNLKAKTVVLHNMNHFNNKRNPQYKQIPAILNLFLEIADK